jgi:hypothetical protein
MAFMDFLPQFGDNMDQSGVDDPTLQAINLKRKLALADSLRNQAVPQGQMVSGHYVRPSWTQSLAHGVNQYLANSTENEAIKNYGEAQKTRQSKMADVLSKLTPHEEQVQLDTVQAGGMPGVMQTQQIQPDVNAAIQGLTELDPNFGAKIAENRIAKALTPKEPMKIGAGEVLLDPNTMKPLYTAPNKPAAEHTPQIKQLIDLRNTLDPKSADYKIISDAIKKESTFAPNMTNMPIDMTAAQNIADLIGQNKMLPPTGRALQSNFNQTVMGLVKDKYPEWAIGGTQAQIKGLKDFTTGIPGNTVRSLNVAVNHLDTAQELANALNNNDIPTINKAANALSQATGSPTVTNFDSAKGIIADEVAKGVLGNGAGALADRIEFADKIRNSSSPAQLAGTIKTWQQLLAGQLGGLKQQYTSFGGSENDFNKKLSSRTQQVLGGIAPSHSTQSNIPAVGEIKSGYKFKGGNPADQNSWEKI